MWWGIQISKQHVVEVQWPQPTTYLIRNVLVHFVPRHQLLHYLQPPIGTCQQKAVQVILYRHYDNEKEYSNVSGGHGNPVCTAMHTWSVRLGSNPCSSMRSLRIFGCPSLAALCRQVWPRLSKSNLEGPKMDRRYFTTSKWPPHTARCRAFSWS